MRFGLESDSWIRLLGTLERIAEALTRIAELAEQAAAAELKYTIGRDVKVEPVPEDDRDDPPPLSTYR